MTNDALIENMGLSAKAREAVRLDFNPSGLPAVTEIKALAAAFITLCNALSVASGASPKDPNAGAGHEFAVAVTFMQTASMWAVLGATKDVSREVPPVDTTAPDA